MLIGASGKGKYLTGLEPDLDPLFPTDAKRIGKAVRIAGDHAL